MKRIIVIEDDKNLNRGITLKLQKEGYKVSSAFTLKEASLFMSKETFDLIISDINLPDGSGFLFCEQIRKKSKIYIIFLTALDNEIDIVNGYDIGADDYITKPFSLMVLISKVNACMRRVETKQINSLVSDDIQVCCQEMKAYKNGEELGLSKKEMQLLVYLMEYAGMIISKEQILENIWDIDGQFVDDNTVAVNISRLRSKLGETEDKKYIQNVRGMGYIWKMEIQQEYL